MAKGVAKAFEVLELMRSGAIDGLSIGFKLNILAHSSIRNTMMSFALLPPRDRVDMRHRTRATHPFKAVRRKLEIPPEWPEMCIWFDPRMHSEYIKWEDRFDFVVSQVDRRKRQVVRWFIVDVLENVHDPKELYRIWRAAGSNTYDVVAESAWAWGKLGSLSTGVAGSFPPRMPPTFCSIRSTR